MPQILPSRELAEALREAGLIPVCVSCKKRKGLCAYHRRHVLPLLKQSGIWYQLMGKKRHAATVKILDLQRALWYEQKSKRRALELQRAIDGGRYRRGRVRVKKVA